MARILTAHVSRVSDWVAFIFESLHRKVLTLAIAVAISLITSLYALVFSHNLGRAHDANDVSIRWRELGLSHLSAVLRILGQALLTTVDPRSFIGLWACHY